MFKRIIWEKKHFELKHLSKSVMESKETYLVVVSEK